MSDNALNNGDSPDLEALFDSIVQSNSAENESIESEPKPHSEQVEAMAEPAKSMFSHIGQITRKLHDTLRELGLDKSLESAAASIPDARDRLSYVATMTEQAAERTLNALDVAKPLQDSITESSKLLALQWDKLYKHELSVEEFKTLVESTRIHLATTAQKSEQVSGQMLEIMMAQDFQDLTGQVIKRVLSMAKDMESHLLDFLLMFNPQGPSKTDDASLLNGPVVSIEGRTDIVTNQEQVDDLLESLGF